MHLTTLPYLQKSAGSKIVHHCSQAESPGRGLMAVGDGVAQCAQQRTTDADLITLLMSEAASRLLTILGRRKQGPEKKHEAVRVLVITADSLGHEIQRVTADQGHGTAAFKRKAVVALDLQIHDAVAHVIERKRFIEQTNKRADRTGRIIVLGLAQQQCAAAFEITQIDVIAQGDAMHLAPAVHRQHNFRLGIVPFRLAMNSDFAAAAHCGQNRCLRENLRIRADTDLQVLRPHTLLDQHSFKAHRFWRARLDCPQVIAYYVVHQATNTFSFGSIASGLLLDYPLNHAGRERHPGRLDDLQIRRRQQRCLVGIGMAAGVPEQRLDSPDVSARRLTNRQQRRGVLQQFADCRKSFRKIKHTFIAQHHRRGSCNRTRDPGTADQRSGQAIHWQSVFARQFQIRHRASRSVSHQSRKANGPSPQIPMKESHSSMLFRYRQTRPYPMENDQITFGSVTRWLKIKHLVLVNSLAKTRNMHTTAEHMNVTQPAISKLLRDLEMLLGFSLFERQTRNLVLTELGEFVARYARITLEDTESFVDQVNKLRKGGHGHLKIGTI